MDRVAVIRRWTEAARGPEEKQALHEAYAALTVEEGAVLARHALTAAWETAEAILLTLACFVPDALQSVHRPLAARDILYPGALYRGADDAITAEFLRRVEIAYAPESLQRSHLLVALSWLGGAAVQARFAAWRDRPPHWRDALSVPPERYAHEAGWELDARGGRRQLYATACYTLVPASGDAPDRMSEACPWCANRLAILFDLDLRDPRLAFLELAGTRLRIAICPNCTDFTTIYTAIDGWGHSAWSPHNRRPAFIGHGDFSPDDDYLTEVSRAKALGAPRRTPYEAHYSVTDWLGLNASQVGGFPTWVQDAAHPQCPRCRETMRFVAQFAATSSDGLIYAFLCAPCGIAATSAQYT